LNRAKTPLILTGLLLLGGLFWAGVALWPAETEAACTGTADCSNITLTVNTTTGGAGRTGNHLNVNVPMLACGSSNVSEPGGLGECFNASPFSNPFNDTSITGTATGVCLNPASLSDSQCLRVPLGANTQFGNGTPTGSSNNSFFQSTNGTFSQNDSVLIPGRNVFQNIDFNNGLKMSMTSIPDPDPNNPNGRIHIIHQTISFSLTEDRQFDDDSIYNQSFNAVYNINAVTDANGNLIGSKPAPGGVLDPRCANFPGTACGTFSLQVIDPTVNCGATVTGIFNVSPDSPTIGPVLPGSPGASFSIACTTDPNSTGDDGCVGPILNPTVYPPGGQFPPFPNNGACLRAGP
jgi:hypothetical protein